MNKNDKFLAYLKRSGQTKHTQKEKKIVFYSLAPRVKLGWMLTTFLLLSTLLPHLYLDSQHLAIHHILFAFLKCMDSSNTLKESQPEYQNSTSVRSFPRLKKKKC